MKRQKHNSPNHKRIGTWVKGRLREAAPRLLLATLIWVLSTEFGSATEPSWWSVVKAPLTGPNAQVLDYSAAANVGQLKNMAAQAMQAMDDSGYWAGNQIHSLVAGWRSDPTAFNDFAALNAGQLKNVGKMFYDRLASLKLRASGDYPWTPSNANNAVVNIGQLKNVFSFDLPPIVTTILIQSGEFQGVPLATVSSSVLSVRLMTPAGAQSEAPVTFTVDQGLISADKETWSTSVDVLSSSSGEAAIYYKAGSVFGLATITVSTGSNPSINMHAVQGSNRLGDVDGDRIPDAWEYARGSDPNDASSVPEYDLIIDASFDPAGPMPPGPLRVQTYAEAVSFVSASDKPSDYHFLIKVLEGAYQIEYSASFPRPVALIAELRSSDRRGAIPRLIPSVPFGSPGYPSQGGFGISFDHDAVLDGIELVAGDYDAPQTSAISVIASPAANAPKVQLNNVIVSNWVPTFVAPPDNVAGGALTNRGGDVWASGCTFFECSSFGSIPPYVPYYSAACLGNIFGKIHLVNSVISNLKNVGWAAVDPSALFSSVTGLNVDLQVESCLLNSGLPHFTTFKGDWFSNPCGGFLISSSTGCIGQGMSIGQKFDINGEPRNPLHPDIGADEWVDSDGDGMADWWEDFFFPPYYFPSSSEHFPHPGDFGAYDSTSGVVVNLTLLECYNQGWLPVYQKGMDTNGNGALDWDEYLYFRTLLDTTPGSPASIADSDGDGLLDVFELGVSHTNPLLFDTDGDGIPDGIAWRLGFLSFSADVKPGPPQITLINPIATLQ